MADNGEQGLDKRSNTNYTRQIAGLITSQHQCQRGVYKRDGNGAGGDPARCSWEGIPETVTCGRRGPVGTRTDLTSSPTMERLARLKRFTGQLDPGCVLYLPMPGGE
jgi:hypothetical protein